MRPFFNRNGLWAYPVFAAVGGSFGYWLQGVSERQDQLLQERKYSLLEKRRRRAEKEGKALTEPMDGGPLGEGQGDAKGTGGGEREFVLGRQ